MGVGTEEARDRVAWARAAAAARALAKEAAGSAAAGLAPERAAAARAAAAMVVEMAVAARAVAERAVVTVVEVMEVAREAAARVVEVREAARAGAVRAAAKAERKSVVHSQCNPCPIHKERHTSRMHLRPRQQSLHGYLAPSTGHRRLH